MYMKGRHRLLVFVEDLILLSSSSLCVDHGVVPSERPQKLGCKVAAAADVVLAAAVVGHPDVHVEGGLAVLRREGT